MYQFETERNRLTQAQEEKQIAESQIGFAQEQRNEGLYLRGIYLASGLVGASEAIFYGLFPELRASVDFNPIFLSPAVLSAAAFLRFRYWANQVDNVDRRLQSLTEFVPIIDQQIEALQKAVPPQIHNRYIERIPYSGKNTQDLDPYQ